VAHRTHLSEPHAGDLMGAQVQLLAEAGRQGSLVAVDRPLRLLGWRVWTIAEALDVDQMQGPARRDTTVMHTDGHVCWYRPPVTC